MSYPKNKLEWWTLVDNNWDNLMDILAHHIDMGGLAYEEPGASPVAILTGRVIYRELIFLRDSRDSRLARYFNAAWGLASDAYAWSVPGWGVLCDLCSEEYVLHEEEV